MHQPKVAFLASWGTVAVMQRDQSGVIPTLWSEMLVATVPDLGALARPL